MEQVLTRDHVVAVLLEIFKEVQESTESSAEMLATSTPGVGFEYIDSQILVAVTGMVAAELQMDIPNSCQLFLGKDRIQLTVEEAADKLLALNSSHGPR